MTPLVPKKMNAAPSGQLFAELSDLLLSALNYLGASAGWIGLQDNGGRLTFPVRAGALADSWLPWQQGYGGVWGFTIGGEPALLNDLKCAAELGEPPLRNLLSCPLIQNKQILGHVALANKAQGFTVEDARVLQGFAHHMVRLLSRRRAPSAAIELSPLWRRILDRAAEGIVVLDETGALHYANTVWLEWTGFRAEELLGRTAPFPFWVSQQDLVQALAAGPAAPARALPFRRRDQSLFWCLLESSTEQWGEHLVTVAFLRQTADVPAVVAGGDGSSREEPPSVQLPGPDWLPLLLDLDDGIEGWEERWQEQTGLSAEDVENSRTVLVLDWLFPQQHDRDRVFDCFHHPRSPGCQLVLEVVAANGSRSMLCTFLPLPRRNATALPRRWLLLVAENEPEA